MIVFLELLMGGGDTILLLFCIFRCFELYWSLNNIMCMKVLTYLFLLFSLSSFAQKGPGGVSSNLVLWLDATEITGVDGQQINNWPDKSQNPISLNSTKGASLDLNSVNGLNSLHFNGNNQYYEAAFAGKLTPPSFTIFTTNRIQNSNDYKAVISNRDDQVNGTQGYILYGSPNNNRWEYWTGNFNTAWQPIAPGVSTLNDWSSQTLIYKPYNYTNVNNKNKSFYINNFFRGSEHHLIDHNTNKPLRIGAGYNEANPQYFFKGDMTEIIMYNTVLNTAQITIVNNYLSAKYDFTLDNNDFYTMDDSGYDYDYDLVGIGRDNNANQHLSSIGTGLLSINKTSLSNNQYLFIASNRLSTDFTDYNDTPPCFIRTKRMWGVSNIASVGAVNLEFNISISIPANTYNEIYIIIDSNHNGDFSDEIPIKGVLNAYKCNFNNIQLNDTDSFSLAIKHIAIKTNPIVT